MRSYRSASYRSPSPEQQAIKQYQATTYLTEISSNPFALQDDEAVTRAKAAAKARSADIQKGLKHLPVANRFDHAGRSAMLSLQDKQPPPILKQIQPSIEMLAATIPMAQLSQTAPNYVGRFEHLARSDRDFLERLDRDPVREHNDEILRRQREIFLVELALKTRREEIAQIEGEKAAIEARVKKAEIQLIADQELFYKTVKESDTVMGEVVQQLEEAKKKRMNIESGSGQYKTKMIEGRSEMEKLELERTKLLGYRRFIEVLLNEAEARTLQDQQKTKRQNAIRACIKRFGTADGLCLDCFTFNGEYIIESPTENCKHKTQIAYDSIKTEHPEEYSFLHAGQPAIAEDVILTAEDTRAEMLGQLFIPVDKTSVGVDTDTFVDALRFYEGNNFKIVEEIQNLENLSEHLRKERERIQMETEEEHRIVKNDLERYRGLVENGNEEEVREALRLIKISREQASNQQLVLRKITEAFVSVSSMKFHEAQSISTFSQLSQMEQKLEQLADQVGQSESKRQKQFELSQQVMRSKENYQLTKDEEQLKRDEKVEKQRLKNNEPIRQTTVRKVMAPAPKLKRHLKTKTEIEVQKQQEGATNYYDQKQFE